MTRDILACLQAADPAVTLDRTPPETLQRRVTSSQPDRVITHPRSRVKKRGLALAGATAAIGGAAFGLPALDGGTGGPSLSARAYAATAAGPDVLYTRVRSTSHYPYTKVTGGTGATDVSLLNESWLFGDRGRQRSTTLDAQNETSDLFLDDAGRVHLRTSDGGPETTSTDADGPDARDWHARLQQDPVSAFRRGYEQGTLDPTGAVDFHGQKAERYTLVTSGGLPNGDHAERTQVFFVRVKDGMPLGRRVREVGTTAGITLVSTEEEVIEAIEHRPASPENLAIVNGG